MAIITDMHFLDKANALKKELKTNILYPQKTVEFVEDERSFQNIKVLEKEAFTLPVVLNSGTKILLDFGEHCVGYLTASFSNCGKERVCDSPVRIKFSFGEFPLEILKPIEEYKGTLGNGWFQREERFMPFMPHSLRLERRYAFRYLLIERVDNAGFPVELNAVSVKAVSAVDINDVAPVSISDERLEQIYFASLKTLKECEQDVFEDGPKRDRRLWLGDLRVQALTDYMTFKNYDLVKRCLYLFACCRTDTRLVSSCFFADSPPYIDDKSGWILKDYCLFFVSCLYDYYKACNDIAFVNELYSIAEEQIHLTGEMVGKRTNVFVDWCPELDKEVAFMGEYLYAIRQFKLLAELLHKETSWITEEIRRVTAMLLEKYKNGLFVTTSGQISVHSQAWAVLSGAISREESIKLLNKTETLKTEYTIRTPFAMHYYIEALFKCGLRDKAMDKIKAYWGKMLDAGYDCCPECFNENNDFESPYNAPEINSACHAWSCTPAYWILKYINGDEI
ncbi:MAG: sugar hydrolase [Clostridia bacterium]|nr:sugar hydrolase [Clostridia bacterium]